MPLHGIRRARRAGLLQPHYGAFALILLLTLLISGANALEPLVLKLLFDDLHAGGSGRLLMKAVGAMLLIGLTRESFTAVAGWLTWRTRLRLHLDLLNVMISRLHRLPVSFYRSEPVGSIMTKLDRGITGVIEAASQLAFNVLPAIVFLVLSVAVMLRLDWRLALVVVALSPLPPIIAASAANRQTERERGLMSRWTAIYSRFNEVLSGIVTVKSFVREEEEKRRFLRDVGEANELVVRGVRFDNSVSAAQNFAVTLARAAALAVGGWLALNGEITVGTLVAFLGYVGSLFGPVQGLSSVYRTFRTASASLEAIYSIVDAQETIGDMPDAVDLPRVRGEVLFDGVEFGYGPERPLLRGIDLHVRPGETVAFVGPSGSGKTTLMALLQRFYDPVAGRILVDGTDIRTVRQKSLRRNIGVVLQESLLFDDTIESNIGYGKPDATREEIRAAAVAAQVDAFIRELPDGYQTRAGERGSRLSGGERQRVSLARVFLKDPPIVVLDEATSSLDAESEALVQEAVERLLRNRTTFVIAHRLATVVNADRVCVLVGGRLVECGSHAQLMAQDGVYASLVRRQTRGLLPA